MDVFLSWSGQQSEAVAQALRDWLPNVIQAVKPWISASDIATGTRWATEITERLEKTRVGVLCLTAENLSKPWILFEAGALSKTVAKTFVCPYLFNIDPVDVQWPLAMFQATRADREGTRNLLATINQALGVDALAEQRLNEIFDVWWPKLEERLSTVPISTIHERQRTDRELLEEVLELVRSQVIQAAEDEGLLVERLMSELNPSFHRVDEQGRKYRLESLFATGPGRTPFEWRGFTPPEGRTWRYNRKKLTALASIGRIEFPKDKTRAPLLRRYADESYKP